MKNFVLIIIGILLVAIGFNMKYHYVEIKWNEENSDFRFSTGAMSSTTKKYPYLYYIPETGGYVNFEDYMWITGFPDTIIVKFTHNGEFKFYAEAVRYEVLRDSSGNKYSPSYIFRDAVGHSWIYDIKGKFLEFNESPYPHSTKDTEEPYKP